MLKNALRLAISSTLAIRPIRATLNETSATPTTSASSHGSSVPSTISPEHSPNAIPVFAQILILHLIAFALGGFFYMMRRYVIARLNQRSVAIPNLRMTHRRKRKSSVTKAGSSLALKKRLKEAKEAHAKQAS